MSEENVEIVRRAGGPSTKRGTMPRRNISRTIVSLTTSRTSPTARLIEGGKGRGRVFGTSERLGRLGAGR